MMQGLKERSNERWGERVPVNFRGNEKMFSEFNRGRKT